MHEKKIVSFFALISRTNFSRNFVRVLCATVRDFSAGDNSVKAGKKIENKTRACSH
jgi:hypothetical protein